MNEETLKTLVPPAGVRAKLLHKIRKLDDKSKEVRIMHEVSTEARPVYEAVNAETVSEASSAPTVDKEVRTYLQLQCISQPIRSR